MRPTYHFAPKANWLSDPNGLVHHDGQWHLFYQYNPQGEDWGHMSWGHAVSSDLGEWEELPPALLEDDEHMIFSGSAVVDATGSAGFGAGAMVAIYTDAVLGDAPRQSQCLAWSNDGGLIWHKYAGNPVLDLGLADFRDPNVFWHDPSGQWIMVVALSDANRALIFGSDDLKSWRELSAIDGEGVSGEVWECPLLIELPVEDGGTRWLFKIDVLRGAPGSGALYCTGSFDGAQFVRDGDWQIADAGADFYAAIAWHEPRDAMGRPLWIGWMGNHAYQGALPLQGWRGAMSLPRRIGLRRNQGTLRLYQEIELGSVATVEQDDPASGTTAIAAGMRLASSAFSLRLADAAGRTMLIERGDGLLRVTRHDPVSPCLDALRETSVGAGAAIDLWLDAGALELIADNGATALTMQHRLDGCRLSLGWNDGEKLEERAA